MLFLLAQEPKCRQHGTTLPFQRKKTTCQNSITFCQKLFLECDLGALTTE